MEYNPKTAYKRIGDRSWKSPQKRLQVIALSGLIMLSILSLAGTYNSLMTSVPGKTKVEQYDITHQLAVYNKVIQCERVNGKEICK